MSGSSLAGKARFPKRLRSWSASYPFWRGSKRRAWLYLVALIYLITAVLVFQRHRSTSGSLLAFFLLSGALYFISAAPVATRSLTLSPLSLKILVRSVYLSAGGLITLVHFAFVFPKPKEILKRFPAIPYLFYGYFLLTVILYFSGIIAFGATFPFLCLWVLVMVGAFLHSLLKEEDPFLKKQISLSLFAPAMVGSVFVVLFLLPGVAGMASMQFTYLALFSLILPYALPSAVDNLCLYQERIEVEQKSQREKEQIRRELHDSIQGDLANISVFSRVSLNLLDRGDVTGVREKLDLMREIAESSSRQLQSFIWGYRRPPQHLGGVLGVSPRIWA